MDYVILVQTGDCIMRAQLGIKGSNRRSEFLRDFRENGLYYAVPMLGCALLSNNTQPHEMPYETIILKMHKQAFLGTF